MEWYLANSHFCEHSKAAQELFKTQLSAPAKHVTGMGDVVSHKELCARWLHSETEKSLHIETESGGYSVGVDIETGKGRREYSVGIDKKKGNERGKEGSEEEKGKWEGNGVR